MKRFLSIAVLFCLLSGSLLAIPAYRKPRTVVQSDGTELIVINNGDELFHYYTTLDGMLLKRGEDKNFYYAQFNATGKLEKTTTLAHNESQRAEKEKALVASIYNQNIQKNISSARSIKKAKRQQNIKKSTVVNKGKVNVLILLVQFPDKKFSETDANTAFNERANGENYTKDGAVGSIKEYFVAQSGGLFTPNYEVVGPVTLDNGYAYYGANDYSDNDQRPAEMVRDACEKAKDLTDFTDFDSDNDGVVDVVYTIYAGQGEASGGSEDTIWPHQWELRSGLGSTYTVDGIEVNGYACSNEMVSGKVTGMGTFCHEFSHSIGLPDFYDTEYSGLIGMNYWSLMDMGSYLNNGYTPCGYTAFEKASLGWITPEVISSSAAITTPTLANGGKAYKIVNPENADEFYILDNRRKEGFDIALPGEGLMVSHIDYDASVWSSNVVNNTTGHERCTVLCADDTRDESYYSAAGDLYPGTSNNTSISATTSPAMTWFTTNEVQKTISNITENEDGTISFTVAKNIETPIANEASEITETGFTANWEAVEGATSYTIEVLKKENGGTTPDGEALLSEDFDKISIAAANSNISDNIDYFTTTTGWYGAYLYGGDKKLRIGSSSNQGYVLTPYFDADGSITVDVDVQKYNPADQSKLYICLDADSNTSDSYIDQWVYDLSGMDGTAKHIQCVLTGAVADSYVAIITDKSSAKKRAYIDNLVITKGDASAASNSMRKTLGNPNDPDPKGNGTYTPADPYKKPIRRKVAPRQKNIANILTTSYTVSGLENGATYTYRVKAVGETTESDFSQAVTVTLSTSGVANTELTYAIYTIGQQLYFTAQANEQVNIYTTNGTLARSFTANDGLNTVSLKDGLYLVRIGTTTTKVMISNR
ncbi:MAG: M6 family metalloprotease domain-containing protein [Bacteroidaceae bacterium]